MIISTATTTTRLGITAETRVYDQEPGGASTPIVFFHGATGLFDDEPMLDALGKKYQIYAPSLPGFGVEADDSGESQLDDMLAVTLHAWDLVDAIKDAAGFRGSVQANWPRGPTEKPRALGGTPTGFAGTIRAASSGVAARDELSSKLQCAYSRGTGPVGSG